MTDQKKGQPQKASPEKSQADITTSTGKAPTKISRVLGHFLKDLSLNRFEAERLGDHCLHSTISSLSNGYGLKFNRLMERVPNHWGLPCLVTRYSLPASEHKRGRNVLAMLEKTGASRQKVAA
ncbi:hypothetical protein [Pseudomonas fluorescens]|jgi:hypothetical protein|uniref:Uncharacterized protein n=1 Tax=Pseudomonas fluorescens TaxID=294 RepID=A0A5E7RH34_PSEFL|nr:hypothetical protein [Pseudomonas fluorescens]VVP73636.1 hypothetical protein PS941_00067 [Pseudomonas fluorescens]